MRHRVGGRQLGRNSGQRRALYRNQLVSLFTHGRIKTTEAKAKELRPMAEKVVTIARQGNSPATRGHLMAILANAKVVDAMLAEDGIGVATANRAGGYTRIFHLGIRPGDGAPVCLIELLDM